MGIQADVQQSRQKIFFLDFIRVVLTLMIIIYHFNGQVHLAHPSAPYIDPRDFLHQAIGDLGVTLFIILSGTSLMVSTLSSFRLIEFIKRRIIGIFPAYWVAYIAVSVVIFIVDGGVPGDYPYWTFSLTAIGMDGYLGYWIPNYYAVGEWFVGFVLCMYFLFPFARIGVLKAPILTALFVLALFTALHWHYHSYFSLAENRNPLLRLPEFVFGMIFIKYKRAIELPLLFASAAIVALFTFWAPDVDIEVYGMILGIATFCLLAFIAAHTPIPAPVERLVNWASKYSFLAFLLHHQLIYVLLPRFRGARFTDIETWYLFAVVVGFSFGGAMLLERPVAAVAKALRSLMYHATLPNTEISASVHRPPSRSPASAAHRSE